MYGSVWLGSALRTGALQDSKSFLKNFLTEATKIAIESFKDNSVMNKLGNWLIRRQRDYRSREIPAESSLLRDRLIFGILS